MKYIENKWYLACLNEELEQQNPLPKKILGRELVIFKTESGKIGVTEDRCCHRNVNLSLGYVEGEHIKCAYHGWEYDAGGVCVNIPSLPADKPIPSVCKINTFKVKLAYNSVWVFIGNPELAENVSLPPMHEMDNLPRVYNYHFFDADLKLTAESLIDAYHINHVHRNSIGSFMGNLHSGQVDFNIRKGEDWLTGTYMRMNEGSFWEKMYFGKEETITTHFGFWFPNVSKLDICFPKRRMIIYEHFYQVDENSICMCQITLWDNIFPTFPSFARKFMFNKSVTIVEEDLIFLENSKMLKDRSGHKDLLVTPSDEVTFEFTKIWNKNIGFNEGISEEKNQG